MFASPSKVTSVASDIFQVRQHVTPVSLQTGITGEVIEVNLAACVLFSSDNETVTIPNAKVWGNPLKNVSRKSVRLEEDVPCTVAMQRRLGLTCPRYCEPRY